MKKEQPETEVYHAALPLSSAVLTGLEPATPCVTGRYSNQLNYHTVFGRRMTVAFDCRGFACEALSSRLRVQSYYLFLFLPNFFE